MKEDIKYQKFKKILKYAILFVLGCIMIYSCNIGEVSALTLGSGSIYSCNASDTVVNSTYSYLLDGDFYNGYLGTTYQGVMQGFNINFNASIQQGNTYTLDLYANTGDWRNISSETIQVFGSLGSKTCSNNVNAYTITSVTSTYYKISITFISNSTASYSQLSLANLNGNPLTGITNWKIDSLVLTDYGNSNTSDIIDNQNKQTETIIQNDKENTQDIIDNQDKNNEELKEEIKENFNTCYTNIFDATSYKSNTFSSVSVNNNDVTVSSTSSWKTLTYEFNVEVGEQYTLYYEGDDNIGVYYYNGSGSNDNFKRLINSTFTIVTPKTNILTIRLQNIDAGTTTFSNLLLVKGVTSTFIPFGQEVCSNKLDNITGGLNDLNENQQATNDKLDDLQDSITDSSAPDTSGLSNAAGWLPPGPVDSLVNLPINLLNSLLGNMGTTCNPINLTLPFVNKSFTIPCPTDLLNRLGDNFITFWESMGLIAGCWCLYKYFINLYKWVESALTMDEKEQLGKWGGV